MIYEFIAKNRRDIDIITSFLIVALPIVLLYIDENSFHYIVLMIVLGIANHYSSSIRREEDVDTAIKKQKRVLYYPNE